MPGSQETAPGGPLDGIRVLDLSSVVMGPLATQILGDLGADVITVETRDGDINRIMGSGPRPGLSGVSLNLLRNKRNISLDIAHPDGRAALLRVAAGCDVFVTNLRPGSVGRLRLRYPDIAAVRPDVIYCQAHGFPSDSPQGDAPAFDDIIQAACGVPDVLRRASGRPGLMPTLLADKVSGLVLAYSIIAADSGRRGARSGRAHRRAARGQASGRRMVQGDPAAGPFLGDPGFGAPAGPAGRAAYPRGAGRGRPDRRADNPAGRGGRTYRRPGWSRKASTCWLNRSGWSTLQTWPASGITACAARGSLAAMYSAAPR